MWAEALRHVVGCWTNEYHEFAGEHWTTPRRRVQPKPLELMGTEVIPRVR